MIFERHCEQTQDFCTRSLVTRHTGQDFVTARAPYFCHKPPTQLLTHFPRRQTKIKAFSLGECLCIPNINNAERNITARTPFFCRHSGQFYIDHSDLICQILMETAGILVDKYPANPYASLRQQEDELFSCSPMKMSGNIGL